MGLNKVCENCGLLFEGKGYFCPKCRQLYEGIEVIFAKKESYLISKPIKITNIQFKIENRKVWIEFFSPGAVPPVTIKRTKLSIDTENEEPIDFLKIMGFRVFIEE